MPFKSWPVVTTRGLERGAGAFDMVRVFTLGAACLIKGGTNGSLVYKEKQRLFILSKQYRTLCSRLRELSI